VRRIDHPAPRVRPAPAARTSTSMRRVGC
jgi:hypothetical protein